MANLTAVEFDCVVEDVAEGVHDWSSDTVQLCLSNTAPTQATDDELADITQIAGGNGYTTNGTALTVTSSSQTSGTYSLVITNDVTWTASGGAIATFRYLVLYNQSATNDELIAYWDIGSATDLSDGDSYTADISGTNLIQIAR